MKYILASVSSESLEIQMLGFDTYEEAYDEMKSQYDEVVSELDESVEDAYINDNRAVVYAEYEYIWELKEF